MCAHRPIQGRMTLLEDYRREAVSTAKRAGTESARRGDPDLYDAALAAIELRAATGQVFDADDIRLDIGTSGSAVGSAFRQAAQRGLIRVYGTTTTRAVTSHGRLLRLWQGVPT